MMLGVRGWCTMRMDGLEESKALSSVVGEVINSIKAGMRDDEEGKKREKETINYETIIR